MRPNCSFCGHVITAESDRAIYDDGWSHELCWWKRECARLQGVIDELKDTCDGSIPSDRRLSNRNAQHHIGSEPTVVADSRRQYCEEDHEDDP